MVNLSCPKRYSITGQCLSLNLDVDHNIGLFRSCYISLGVLSCLHFWSTPYGQRSIDARLLIPVALGRRQVVLKFQNSPLWFQNVLWCLKILSHYLLCKTKVGLILEDYLKQMITISYLNYEANRLIYCPPTSCLPVFFLLFSDFTA